MLTNLMVVIVLNIMLCNLDLCYKSIISLYIWAERGESNNFLKDLQISHLSQPFPSHTLLWWVKYPMPGIEGR